MFLSVQCLVLFTNIVIDPSSMLEYLGIPAVGHLGGTWALECLGDWSTREQGSTRTPEHLRAPSTLAPRVLSSTPELCSGILAARADLAPCSSMLEDMVGIILKRSAFFPPTFNAQVPVWRHREPQEPLREPIRKLRTVVQRHRPLRCLINQLWHVVIVRRQRRDSLVHYFLGTALPAVVCYFNFYTAGGLNDWRSVLFYFEGSR